jgi:deoxyribodipyrimidine photo-lyase
MSTLIPEERVRKLNQREIKDRRYVLYWMQSSQRVEYNFALAYAISKANKLNKPLIVFFGVTPTFPEANLRHYHFMLEGLQETSIALQEIGVGLVLLNQSPEKGAVELSKDSCLTVVDKGYLRTLRQWYRYAAKNIDCPFIQVEDNVVVPVDEASGKEEYSARTIRPKILDKRYRFLSKLAKAKPAKDSLNLEIDTSDVNDIAGITAALNIR